MFTGLVECTGTVTRLEDRGEQARLTIQIPFATELALGDSVATNGCCLTVAEMSAEMVHFDVLRQTLDVTSIGGLKEGSVVNLERALRLGDRLGGQFVQGHIDDTGTVTDLSQVGQDHRLEVSLPGSISRLCIDKGSLAVDGISLTIAELLEQSAVFWITPHTYEHTHLHALEPGSRVNLEADMLAKHIARLHDARSS